MNAVQAAGEGGEVGLSTGVDGTWLWVCVDDDGPGIPAENLDRLFDPFFTTRPVGEGTGLGLYDTCQTVTSYGGEIRVRSELDSGTRFEVRLPLESARRA